MPRSESPPDADTRAPALLLLGIVLAAATDALPQALGQVARPELAGFAGASVDEGAWLVIAFAAGKSLGFLLVAPFILTLGIRRALTSIALAQAACAVVLGLQSTYMGALVGRAVQGFLGGAMLAGAYGALVGLVPRAHHALALGLWGVTTLLLPALFSALGGAWTDALDWQHAMMGCVPIGLAAAWVLQRALPRKPWPSAGPWGAPSLAVLLCALLCVGGQFIATQGTRYNWDDVPFMMPLVVALGVAAALLAAIEWRRPHVQALFHRGPFGLPEFNFSLLMSLVAGYGATATIMLAPLYVRKLFGVAAHDAGFMQLPSLIPGALALAVSAIATQRQWLSALHLILMGAGMFLLSLLLWAQATWQVDLGFVATIIALRGAGLGLMAVPSARLAFARLHEREALYAAGYFQAARQWGGALATLSITWRLAERTARFQYHLAQHMTVADPAITQRLLGEGQALAARGGPAWEPQALGTVLSAQALHNQVLVLAYNACFMEICVVYGGLMALALGYRAIADRVRAR